jgi:hypothetical protein
MTLVVGRNSHSAWHTSKSLGSWPQSLFSKPHTQPMPVPLPKLSLQEMEASDTASAQIPISSVNHRRLLQTLPPQRSVHSYAIRPWTASRQSTIHRLGIAISRASVFWSGTSVLASMSSKQSRSTLLGAHTPKRLIPMEVYVLHSAGCSITDVSVRRTSRYAGTRTSEARVRR